MMLAFGATVALAFPCLGAAEAEAGSLRGAGASVHADGDRHLGRRRLRDEAESPVAEAAGNATDTEGQHSVAATNAANLVCIDTPGWTNGWKPCDREHLGNDPRYCRPGGGWTCEGYVANGWCRNDRCLSPREINGVYACGHKLKSPEANCCACGKPAEPPPVTTCGREGCGGAYKPGNSCQCTYECKRYGNCCRDFDSLCRVPTPAPAPAPPALCQYYGCGGGYKPGQACQCNRDCERNNNCCQDYWSQCKSGPPSPPSPPPMPIDYEEYHGRNAFQGHGATNIDSDATAPTGLSGAQCEERCTRDPQCSCVTFQPRTGKCWKRGNCYEPGWQHANNYDVYLKKTQRCLPEHAVCGGAGQRDGSCCPGSTCQEVFDSDRKYCTASSGQHYTKYYNKNAYSPYGATNIDDQNSAPSGLSAQQCKERCSADIRCSCVTLERSSGKCWKRANCNPSGFTSPHNYGFNVYMKDSVLRSSAAANTSEANTSEEVFYP